MRAWPSTGALQPGRRRAPAAARSRTPASTLLAAGGARRRHRARRSPSTDDADNMTDRMAALDDAVAASTAPERAGALDDFYSRYADDPLIIDKWFALQAAIPEPATLDRVRALTTHPAFSMSNPNRVRSLIGNRSRRPTTPSSTAPTAPATTSVADTVLALDAEQPAGRRAADRRRVPLLARARAGPARAARRPTLKRVAAAPRLSRDVDDIVARTLAGLKQRSRLLRRRGRPAWHFRNPRNRGSSAGIIINKNIDFADSRQISAHRFLSR